MTFELLTEIVKENNIPSNVELLSDSGWECNETGMNGVYYNRNENRMIFTQEGTGYDRWFEEDGWEMVYGRNKTCQTCSNLDGDKCRYISHVYLINTNDCSSYKEKGEK